MSVPRLHTAYIATYQKIQLPECQKYFLTLFHELTELKQAEPHQSQHAHSAKKVGTYSAKKVGTERHRLVKQSG